VAKADPYAILRVAPDADVDDIRDAYRRLARIHHPDVGGSGDRMAELNEAWALLSDPRQRRAYDRLRREAHTERGLGPIAARVARHAGTASGTELGFGQYSGWSLANIARHDPEYLAWLARHPSGRRYRAEIEGLGATADRAADRSPR
jgi:curved DNA-binding protein CbpA